MICPEFIISPNELVRIIGNKCDDEECTSGAIKSRGDSVMFIKEEEKEVEVLVVTDDDADAVRKNGILRIL
jgi:hypothetical protein